MKSVVYNIMIIALLGVIIALILTRGCGRVIPPHGGIDVELVYDSIKREIISELPPPDTILQVVEKDVVRWLPGATVRDTIYVNGETIHVYHDTPIDTNAILTHYLTQAVTYVDTIEDSSLRAVISDVIFRNGIAERDFSYVWKPPVEIRKIDNRDRFQMIASFQAGGGMTYTNTPQSIYAGVDLGLKFKNGTYFSVGYMAGSGHSLTLRAGQVIRLWNAPKRIVTPIP